MYSLQYTKYCNVNLINDNEIISIDVGEDDQHWGFEGLWVFQIELMKMFS